MRIAQYINGQYLDQVALNLMAYDAASGARQVAGTWALPGLVHPEVLGWSVSGTMLTVNCPPPFAVQFSSGIIAQALGTTPGASGTTYTVQLSGFIPAAGSQVVYINANYFSLGQTSEAIVGPPQGNPAFNPNFAPFNFYTEAVDSIQILASLTPPDGINTFELTQTTLTAGMTGIALGNLSYATQSLASRVLPVQGALASGSMTLTQANAGILQNCTYAGSTIILPPVTQSTGYPFLLYGSSALGSGYATIQAYGTDTIQIGGPNATYPAISLAAGMFIGLVSNGVTWATLAESNAVPISWNASGAPPSPLSISTSGGVQTPYAITASGASNPYQLITSGQAEYLQGNYKATAVLTSGTVTLTTAQFGSVIELYGTAASTVMTPTPVGNAGATFKFWNNSGYATVLETPAPSAFGGMGGSETATMYIAPYVIMTITSDGYNWFVSRQSMIPGFQTYVTAGTYTFTVPAGVTYAKVTVTGGGAGGGYCNTATDTAGISGGGGGAGGTAIGYYAVTPGAAIPVTVGYGGTGGLWATATLATIGGTSSFGSYATATGGATDGELSGGGPGVGSGGQINLFGGWGGDGAAATYVLPGYGGVSYWGGGSRAGEGGGTGTGAPGTGGGGAYVAADFNGANGQPGIVVIEWGF